jgi:DNA primase
LIYQFGITKGVRKMDYRIPDDFIEEVRRRSDIVEIISEYVVLKRTGKNYQGLCPFHSEKTPSFNVNPDRQMFYCFGCQTGGNVFSFLMKKENITFMESLRILAQKAGMVFPEKQLSPGDKKKEIKRKRWQEIHEWAAVFFQNVLLHSPEGQAGLAYLRSRGIDDDTIKAFRLGFAPAKWDGLIKEMNQRGVRAEELAEFGLVVRKEDNKDKISFYDRFRSRIIFTITDIQGNPIAFGGRILDDTLPKYLNSPETQFFQKGRNLYGLHTAYRSIREQGYCLLLEGYMDVIAVWKAGFTNAVASLGTALTQEQARLLKKYASKVIICYDSDEAGIQAALRAGEILLKQGVQVEVLVLEDAKDPDEFLRKHKSEEFTKKLDRALSFIEYKYYTLTKDKPPGSIPEKGRIIRKIAPDILEIASPAERE